MSPPIFSNNLCPLLLRPNSSPVWLQSCFTHLLVLNVIISSLNTSKPSQSIPYHPGHVRHSFLIPPNLATPSVRLDVFVSTTVIFISYFLLIASRGCWPPNSFMTFSLTILFLSHVASRHFVQPHIQSCCLHRPQPPPPNILLRNRPGTREMFHFVHALTSEWLSRYLYLLIERIRSKDASDGRR